MDCIYPTSRYRDEPKTCGHSYLSTGGSADWYFCDSKYRRSKCMKKEKEKQGVVHE
jgi:hypothetical protein